MPLMYFVNASLTSMGTISGYLIPALTRFLDGHALAPLSTLDAWRTELEKEGTSRDMRRGAVADRKSDEKAAMESLFSLIVNLSRVGLCTISVV